MTNSIIACLDGSAISEAVTDAAVWVSQKLSVPIMFINVIDPDVDTSREEGVAVQTLPAHVHGQQVLDTAHARATSSYAFEVSKRLVVGKLLDVLRDFRDDTRVLIVGKRGESSAEGSLGANLAEMIRASHRPTMIVTQSFDVPKKVMLAFDGSESMLRAVNSIAQSPLFKQLECHVVMVGAETEEHKKQLKWAQDTLLNSNIVTYTRLIAERQLDKALNHYAREMEIDMMVMGAYSHNHVWELIMGSKTAKLLQETRMTLLILR